LHGIFESNELWNEYSKSDFIYFGDSDLEIYVFDKDLKKYHAISRYTRDITSQFIDFDDLVLYCLESMLNF
jgi:hypothetical protein